MGSYCDNNEKVESGIGRGCILAQQRTLQHQQQHFKHVAEIPPSDTVQLLLSIMATSDGQSSRVNRSVSVQSLLAKCCEKGGMTGGQDALNLDRRSWRAGKAEMSPPKATH